MFAQCLVPGKWPRKGFRMPISRLKRTHAATRLSTLSLAATERLPRRITDPRVPTTRGAADGRTFLYILLALYYYYFFKRTRLRSTLSAHPNATKKPQPHNNIMITIILIAMVAAAVAVLLPYIFCNTRII